MIIITLAGVSPAGELRYFTLMALAGYANQLFYQFIFQRKPYQVHSIINPGLAMIIVTLAGVSPAGELRYFTLMALAGYANQLFYQFIF